MHIHTILKVALLTCLAFIANAEEQPGGRNGEFVDEEQGVRVWHEALNKWLSPEQFWLAYANENGGFTWGKSSEYPAYEDVKEYDTIIIQLESGDCLMEFYHQRWRRANDVRRWDPQFNGYGGCPNVFD